MNDKKSVFLCKIILVLTTAIAAVYAIWYFPQPKCISWEKEMASINVYLLANFIYASEKAWNSVRFWLFGRKLKSPVCRLKIILIFMLIGHVLQFSSKFLLFRACGRCRSPAWVEKAIFVVNTIRYIAKFVKSTLIERLAVVMVPHFNVCKVFAEDCLQQIRCEKCHLPSDAWHCLQNKPATNIHR